MRTPSFGVLVFAGVAGTALVASADRQYEERAPTARHESSSSGTAAAIYPESPSGSSQRGSATSGTFTSEAGRGASSETGYASAMPDASGSIVQGSEISGRISDVDREDGRVTVDLSNGEEVTLVFPRSALASFREGDPVTLTAHVGMAERAQPPARGADVPDND